MGEEFRARKFSCLARMGTLRNMDFVEMVKEQESGVNIERWTLSSYLT